MIDEISVHFVLAVLVLVVGVLFLFGLYRFGTTLFGSQSFDLFREFREFFMHYGPEKYSYQWWTEALSSWHQSYLEKRNDFWEKGPGSIYRMGKGARLNL